MDVLGDSVNVGASLTSQGWQTIVGEWFGAEVKGQWKQGHPVAQKLLEALPDAVLGVRSLESNGDAQTRSIGGALFIPKVLKGAPPIFHGLNARL